MPDTLTVKSWHRQQIATEREIFPLAPLKTFFHPFPTLNNQQFDTLFQPIQNFHQKKPILNGFWCFEPCSRVFKPLHVLSTIFECHDAIFLRWLIFI